MLWNQNARRLRGEGAFNGIGIPQVFPVLGREVRLRTGEAPPLRSDLLEALDGRLAVHEFAHRPDECLSTWEADQAKTVMVPTLRTVQTR